MTLLTSTRELARRTVAAYQGTPYESEAARIAARLDEPLRVAIAGKVKAGKSTLLNALVGEELAPTDAGECTSIVTWYRHGITYRVTLDCGDEHEVHVRFTHDEGALDIDLGGRPTADVDRILVEWPASSLRDMTLIDTPGIAGLSHERAARTAAFLTPDDERTTEADAVLYLLRHAHSSDVRFLEAFHDQEVAQATPVNAIAVLSRADEIGAGRPDALASARRIADRYRADPELRRLCQTVVPVAGLVAQAAATLREDEFRILARLASAPPSECVDLLLSVDRFADAPSTVELLPLERRLVLERFGLFGVRVAIEAIRHGDAPTTARLATVLTAHSGIAELRSTLTSHFALRAETLKARSALLALDALFHSAPGAGTLAAELEQLEASAHEVAELRLLNLLRTGGVQLRPDDAPGAERLLGVHGASMPARLGLPVDADADACRAAALDALGTWQRRAENPLADKPAADAARILVRSCEGLLAELARGTDPSAR